MEQVLWIVCLASSVAHEFGCQRSICWSLCLRLHFVCVPSPCEHGQQSSLDGPCCQCGRHKQSDKSRVTTVPAGESIHHTRYKKGQHVTSCTVKWVDQKLTRNPIHCNKIAILLLYFWPVSGNQENSEERQKTTGKEIQGGLIPSYS